MFPLVVRSKTCKIGCVVGSHDIQILYFELISVIDFKTQLMSVAGDTSIRC